MRHIDFKIDIKILISRILAILGQSNLRKPFALQLAFSEDKPLLPLQTQKTQGFCVADFATLSDERMLHSKNFLLFNTGKRTMYSKIGRVHTFENSGILQTALWIFSCGPDFFFWAGGTLNTKFGMCY